MISAVLFVGFYKREKADIIQSLDIDNVKSEIILLIDERFNIDQLKEEFTEVVDDRLQMAIDNIGETIGTLLTEPTVKKAFSIIGSQGGEARSKNLAVDEMARDMLDGPQFAAIRMAAEAMGLDIDGYIDKHGAMKTIQAAQQLAQFAGIDIMNLDIGSLAAPGGASVNNPYLGR